MPRPAATSSPGRPEGGYDRPYAGPPSGSGGPGAERAGAARPRRARPAPARALGPRGPRRARRGGRPGGVVVRPGRPRRGLGRPRAAALRPRRRRAVGPRHGGGLGRTRRAAGRDRGRRRAGDDLPGGERAGRAGRSRRGCSPASTRTSGRCCSCSRCRRPTRRATWRCSPAAPCCTARRWARPRWVAGRRCTTLLAEPDFSLASFLLSVLGEGSFLSLLAFLDEHAPDPVTRQVTRLARGRRGPARRVRRRAPASTSARSTRTLRGRLRAAIERRHDALVDTAGLNADVFDALVVLAAGEWTPAAIARGYRAVQDLRPRDGRGPPPSPRPPRLPARRGRRAVRAAHAQLHVRSLNSFRIGTRLRHISTASSRRGVA